MLHEWSAMRPAMRAPLSRIVTALLSALLLTGVANTQAANQDDQRDPRGPATGMATRSVAKYLELERKLQQAIGAHDRPTVAGLLDTDFVSRSAASEDALSQEEWLTVEFGKSRPGARVRDMLVIETEDLATASFLLDTVGGKRGRHTYFIVDVWRQSTGKLLARYSDTPANPPAPPAGANVRE
jgi:hypothetical protein